LLHLLVGLLCACAIGGSVSLISWYLMDYFWLKLLPEAEQRNKRRTRGMISGGLGGGLGAFLGRTLSDHFFGPF
jgi:hypothetical protein